jgi:hypothetical protein
MWRFHGASSLTYCLFGSISLMMLLVSSSLQVVRRTMRRRFHLHCASLMHKQVEPLAFYYSCQGGSFWKTNFKNIHPLVIPPPGYSSTGLYTSFTSVSSSSLLHDSDSSMDMGQIRRLVQDAHDIVQRNMQSLSLSKVQIKVRA